MSRKKRILKITAITLAVLVFLGYFAFSTFLFKPFEKDWPHAISGLIPRQVDFYLSKEDLGQDFAEFPRLAVWDAVEDTKAWRVWSDSPEYEKWAAKNDVDGILESIEQQTAQLPLGLTPLKIFGGREVAVAGDYQGKGLGNAQWMLCGRVGWSGKLAASGLRYPGLLRKFSGQKFEVDESDGIYSLKGGGLKNTIYVTRIQDVVILGNHRELVAKGPELESKGGADSLALSAPYLDNVKSVENKTGETGVQVLLDVGKTFGALGKTGPWPDTNSPRFSQAFLGRLIQAPSCKDVLGLMRFGRGIQLDLSGTFSSESVTPFQSRLYRVNGFERDQMIRDAARLAPADCVLFAYMHGPVTDLLRQVFDSVEPAMRQNIEDAVKSTGHFRNLDDLLDTLGKSLRNRLCVIVRENDYGPVVARNSDGQEFPAETDGAPTFAMTLVTWTQGQDSVKHLDEVRDMVGRNPEKFGLKGYDISNPNDTGYYVFDSDGFDTREFWSPLIPGTGMIATMLTDADHFWITNHERMFVTIRRTYYDGAKSGHPRLSEHPLFRTQVEGALDNANLVVWFNPKNAAPTLRKIAKRWAEDNVMNSINWSQERPKMEREVLANQFGGRTIGQLSPKEVESLRALVDQRLSEWGDEYRIKQVPILMAKRDRDITYMESMEAMLFQLRLDQRTFKLAFRAVVPLDE